MSNKKLLVLFGATGNQGGSTAHFVLDDPTLAKQYAVRAITRDINNSKAQELQKKGAELVAADLDEPSTLPAALRGAHSVFLLTNTQYGGNSREIETRQAKAALGEALKQGVEYVIWSSMSHPYKISGGNLAQVEHFDDKAEIEEYIRGLPIKSAFYAPGSFMQNSSTHMKPRPSPANDGTHILGNLCSSATRIPLIDITDSGKWIGAILAEPDKYEGKFFAAAERLYSFEEIAQVMSKVSGKTVIHQQFPDEVFKSFVPESPLKEALCEMWLFIRDYGYYGTNMERDVEWASQQAKGRLTSLEEYLTKTAEFPVQFLTKIYGFKRVLPTLMFLWGTVSWSQAWMHDRTTFYLSRAALGACEGGFIPGVILFATYFYKSKELAMRLAFFWSSLNIARDISVLLAAGILEMRGIEGKTGWLWLFLLEGLLTVTIALVSFVWLPASPTQTKTLLWRKGWFNEREEVIMVNRILRDDPAKGLTHINEPATFRDIKEAWSDPAMWGLYFIGLIAYIPASPVQGYLTLTLKRLGFTTFNSNMLTVPSAVLQIITMMALAKSSDYFNERTLHIMFGEFWIMPLLVALLSIPDGGREWSHFTLITLVSGYPYFHPLVSSWISENTFDVKKRAITAATYNVIVQFGSVISSQIYRKYDEPYYKQGNSVLIATCALSLVVMFLQRQMLLRLNKKKEAKWQDMDAEEKVVYQSDFVAREKEGNKRLDFRFVV